MTNGASDHTLYMIAGVMIVLCIAILVAMRASPRFRGWVESQGEKSDRRTAEMWRKRRRE